MNLLKHSTFTAWIFNTFSTSVEGLGLYRIFVSLYILFFQLPSGSSYTFLSSMPADFYNAPPGPFMLFNGFPPIVVWYALHCLLVIAAIAMLVGYHTKWASLIVGIAFFFIDGFVFSSGKIIHEILLIITPIVMAFSGWGNCYSIDEKRSINGEEAKPWLLTLLALFIGFMFFTAGFPKILGGWLDLSSHAAEEHFYKQFFVRGRQDLLAPLALNFADGIWEGIDYATIIFEIGFLLAITRAFTTRIFLCIAVIFHLSILLILNIQFLPNFLAYAAFFNWSWLNNILNKKGQTHGGYFFAPALIILFMVLLFGLSQLIAQGVSLSSDLVAKDIVITSVFSLAALIWLLNEMINLFRGRRIINLE